MKTKTIDVWVDEKQFEKYDMYDCDYLLESEKDPDIDYLKAKIIVELPEKKIEITESEFDRKWEYAIGNNFDEDLDSFKQELGF